MDTRRLLVIAALILVVVSFIAPGPLLALAVIALALALLV